MAIVNPVLYVRYKQGRIDRMACLYMDIPFELEHLNYFTNEQRKQYFKELHLKNVQDQEKVATELWLSIMLKEVGVPVRLKESFDKDDKFIFVHKDDSIAKMLEDLNYSVTNGLIRPIKKKSNNINMKLVEKLLKQGFTIKQENDKIIVID